MAAYCCGMQVHTLQGHTAYSLRSLALGGPPAPAPRMNLNRACLTP